MTPEPIPMPRCLPQWAKNWLSCQYDRSLYSAVMPRRMTILSKLRSFLRPSAAIALIAGTSFATTLDVGGVKIQDSIAIYNNTLLLNGAGIMPGGKTPLYAAHIYSKTKFTTLDALVTASGPKRLTLTAIREVDTGPILKMLSRSVEATAAKGDMAKLIPGMMNIGNVFKTNRVLKPGEVMSLDWIPITGLVIYIGGKMQGDPIREPELFRAAMGVWMGEVPADAKLKDALLGHI